MTRTGSRCSRVGPAVTTTRFPDHLLVEGLFPSKRSAAAKIASGSLMRPGRSLGPSASARTTALPERRQHWPPRERFERQRAHEFGGGCGEHHVHRGARLRQAARQKTALVTGDPARHAEHDVTAGEGHQPSCWRRRRTRRYLRPPRTSSSNARVVSFSSQSTDRSRGKSLTKRANLAATRTPRYLFWVCPATSAGVTIRIAQPFC